MRPPPEQHLSSCAQEAPGPAGLGFSTLAARKAFDRVGEPSEAALKALATTAGAVAHILV